MIALMTPYLWSVVGYAVVEKIDLRTFFAKFMLYVLIPIGAFYAFSYYQGNLFSVMFTVALMKATLYFICLFFYRSRQFKPKVAACICGYYNLGWLGIPIASVIYGEKGALIMTAAYMVGQLYGNIVVLATFQSSALDKQPSTDTASTNTGRSNVGKGNIGKGNLAKASTINLTTSPRPWYASLSKLLVMPATYTMILGVINRETNIVPQEIFGDSFTYIKLGMTVIGMSLIGMSLRKSELNKSDYLGAMRFTLFRVFGAFIAVGLVLMLVKQFNILSTDELMVLTMIACLPVGANVVVIEHALLKTGKSAAIVAMTTFTSAFVFIAYAQIIKFIN